MSLPAFRLRVPTQFAEAFARRLVDIARSEGYGKIRLDTPLGQLAVIVEPPSKSMALLAQEVTHLEVDIPHDLLDYLLLLLSDIEMNAQFIYGTQAQWVGFLGDLTESLLRERSKTVVDYVAEILP